MNRGLNALPYETPQVMVSKVLDTLSNFQCLFSIAKVRFKRSKWVSCYRIEFQFVHTYFMIWTGKCFSKL